MDIEREFAKLSKSNWRIVIDNNKEALHLIYREDLMHQHIPDISLFIRKEESRLAFDTAICGKLVPQISEKLNFEDYNLRSLLIFLKEQQPCTGYDHVVDYDSSQWMVNMVMSPHNPLGATTSLR